MSSSQMLVVLSDCETYDVVSELAPSPFVIFVTDEEAQDPDIYEITTDQKPIYLHDIFNDNDCKVGEYDTENLKPVLLSDRIELVNRLIGQVKEGNMDQVFKIAECLKKAPVKQI